VDDVITVYPIVKYRSTKMAQDAFLDAYFGEGAFDRDISCRNAGVELDMADNWFKSPIFFDKIEQRLQHGCRRRNSMQDTMLEECQNILEGNMMDVFDQSPTGDLILKNIKTLPRHVAASIKQMDVVRHSIPGKPAEFTECLRIVMHDKAKVMGIIADFTDVKGKIMKGTDSGAPKMVGLSLTLAMPEQQKEQSDAEISEHREVSDDDGSTGVPD
jgi:hypothetical protein